MRVVVANRATANAVKERVSFIVASSRCDEVSHPDVAPVGCGSSVARCSGPVAPFRHAVENEREGRRLSLGSQFVGVLCAWAGGRRGRRAGARAGLDAGGGTARRPPRARQPGGVGRPIDRGPLAWTAVSGCGATLHTYVKNVRRLLEPGRATGTRSDILVTRRRGYLLRVEADELDAWRAARLIADGRATLVEGDAEAAEARFTDALTLWRGPSFGDLADEPYLQSEATRLDELRLSAIEERVQARISLGRHGELCAEIEGLVGEHPFRERLWEQWMLTLYRSGRQADALRAYQRVRRLLGDELGIEPGAFLRRLEAAILAHDPALDWALGRSATSVVRPPLDPTTGNLPPAPPQLFGRRDAVADIGERLQTTRLLSLVGVGGVGKHRSRSLSRTQSETDIRTVSGSSSSLR